MSELIKQTTIICDDVRVKPYPETIERWNSMEEDDKFRFIIAFPQYVGYIYDLSDEIKEKFIQKHPNFKKYII